MAVLRSLSRVEGLQYDGTHKSAAEIVGRSRGRLTLVDNGMGHRLLLGSLDGALRDQEVVEPGDWVVLTEEATWTGDMVYVEKYGPDDFARLYYVTGDGPERLFA